MDRRQLRVRRLLRQPRHYRYYFRQGFERGYRDAYYGRYQYGYYDRRSDIGVILPAVIGAILGFSLH